MLTPSIKDTLPPYAHRITYISPRRSFTTQNVNNGQGRKKRPLSHHDHIIHHLDQISKSSHGKRGGANTLTLLFQNPKNYWCQYVAIDIATQTIFVLLHCCIVKYLGLGTPTTTAVASFLVDTLFFRRGSFNEDSHLFIKFFISVGWPPSIPLNSFALFWTSISTHFSS